MIGVYKKKPAVKNRLRESREKNKNLGRASFFFTDRV